MKESLHEAKGTDEENEVQWWTLAIRGRCRVVLQSQLE